MLKKKILILCDTSSNVGLGHYSRSKILKKIITKELGQKYLIKILLITNRKIDSINNNLITKYNNNLYNNVKISIKDYSPNIIIFNFSSYFEKQYFFKLIKIIYSKKIKFIGIDNLFKFKKYLSHIWIPNITISKKQIGKNIYFGWDKIIVEKIKKNNVLGKHILFLIGGTDKYKLSEKIPNLLNNKIQSENKFLWVQGPFAKPPKIKKKYKKNWKIYKNPQNIYNLIFKAKCCFVLFGTTFFEVVNAGIPQVTYIPKGKEKQILVKKLKKNFLIENNLKVSLNKINLILKNYDKFKQKAKKNKKLIIFKKRKKFLNYILNFNE